MSARKYLIGFGLSVILTLEAYLLVVTNSASGRLLLGVLLVLALGQLFVQLYFFLHLNRHPQQRWNLWMLGMMVLIVGILVLGTLWIMYNLDYNHLDHPSDQEIIQDEIGPTAPLP